MADAAPKPGRVTPPKKDKEETTAKKEPSKRPPGRKPALEKRLEEFFVTVSMGVTFTGDFYSAEILRQSAENMAQAWNRLAQQDARVKRVIERMLDGGAWGQVISVNIAVALPIMQHHGIYPQGAPLPLSGFLDLEAAEKMGQLAKGGKSDGPTGK